MFSSEHYVPVIKWKRGERTALEHLSSTTRDRITPLLEIQPVPYDHRTGNFTKTIDDHLSSIGRDLNNCWKSKNPVFVDSDTIYDNVDFEDDNLASGQHPLEFIIDLIENEGIPAIPVTGTARDASYQAAVYDIVQKHQRGVCIRIYEEQLDDINQLESEINNLLSIGHINKSDTDLVIDFEQITPSKETAIYNQIINTLIQFPDITTWRTITVCATSIPKTYSKTIKKFSSGTMPRAEWSIYSKIVKTNLIRKPSFGDYTITNPNFVNLEPWFLSNIVSSLKYTCNNDFWVHRGDLIANGFSSMRNICSNVVSDPRFSGQNFSFGDSFIFNCANGGATGNLESWVVAGVNHHLTKVADDLSNLPSTSRTGSPQSLAPQP
ncbi:beta family protein [Paenibacillus sp. ClWae2A]|uniref:beta family protein n=1 Tax=Paenibacillus sp. ClWae2A TaxID=3057177 RepID=UPI0028F5C172|nr:beta family protein [Paenibacillus sp. ClWae2A]MDT9719647.1 beta family protein [Paenibacillus sp. ClWae2A]